MGPQTYWRAYSEGKLGKGIYKHMWLFKGDEVANPEVGKREVHLHQNFEIFSNQTLFGGGTSVHFSLAVLHGYELPPVLLHVAEALRYENLSESYFRLQNIFPGMRLREQCLKRGLVLESGRREG